MTMISSFHRVVAAVYVGLGCCMVDCSLRDENQRQPENETVKLNTTSSLPLGIKDPEKQPVKIRVMPEQVAKYSVGELFVAADSKVGRWKVRMIATDGYGVANSTHFTLVTNFLSGKIATTPGF